MARQTSCVPPWVRSLLRLFPVYYRQALPHIFHPTRDPLLSQPTIKDVTDFSPSRNVINNSVAVLTSTCLVQQPCQRSGGLVTLSPPPITCVPASVLRKNKTHPVDSATDPVAQAPKRAMLLRDMRDCHWEEPDDEASCVCCVIDLFVIVWVVLIPTACVESAGYAKSMGLASATTCRVHWLFRMHNKILARGGGPIVFVLRQACPELRRGSEQRID